MLPHRLEELFFDFNHQNIIWALLRLPSKYIPKCGDVDLLIDPEHLPLAIQCISAHEFIRLPGWKPDYHFLYYDNLAAQWVWLHVVTHLTYGGYYDIGTQITHECLENRQQIDGINQLAPGDFFWELLLHCLIDKGCVSPKYQDRLCELVTHHPEASPFRTLVGGILQPEFSSSQIIQLVHDGDWNRLGRLAREIPRLWRLKKPAEVFSAFIKRIFLRFRKSINILNGRGICVAVIGPDGAGKTTLISEIEKTFIFPTKVVYMGLTGGMLRPIDRLRFPPFVIPLHLLVFWGRFIRAWYYQLRGNLVLFDRYIYDYRVPTPFQQTRLQRLTRWIDGHSCPGPDLVLILDAPGEVMYERKGEYNSKMLEDWRQHFSDLQSIYPRAERIDSSCSIEKMRLDAAGRIWSKYLDRWRKIEQRSKGSHE